MIRGFTPIYVVHSYVADLLEISGVIPPSLQAQAVRRRPLRSGMPLWRVIFVPLILTISFPLGEWQFLSQA